MGERFAERDKTGHLKPLSGRRANAAWRQIIDEIKSGMNVADLIRRRGIELKSHGKDLIGLCPFHNDRKPSLVVTPSKNLWHCLGACQEGGDVIAWVMKIERVSFRHAVELLRRDDVALSKAGAKIMRSRATIPKAPLPVSSDADDQTLLNQAIDFYHRTLKESPLALAYLKERRIDHPEAVDQFKLGFANRTLCYGLPDAGRKLGAKIREQLIRIGLFTPINRELFNGSLVIPIIDETGNVTEVYGRKVRHDLKPGTIDHLYLPGPHKGVWNRPAFAAAKEVILCEALIDALTFWCAGYRNVTAAYGVGGFTADHLEAFKTCGIEKVLIAYDRDAAGDQAAVKLSAKLLAEGFDCHRVEFPQETDANAYAQSVGDVPDALGVLLRSAAWMGKAKPSTVRAVVEGSAPTAPPAQRFIPVEPVMPAVPPPVTEAITAAAGVIEMKFEDRVYRARGLETNTTPAQLRVNLGVMRDGRFHIDTLDLYSDQRRHYFLKRAAQELETDEQTLKRELGQVIFKLEQMRTEQIDAVLKSRTTPPTMTPEDQAEALEALRSPDLLDRIAGDFEALGIVGETTNLLAGYILSISRKLDRPQHLLIQSSSAAGKTVLMDAILSLAPPEDVVKFSAMTGQALFYLDDVDLRHKILAIAEEAGAEKADYAIKLLMSDGGLTIATTMKDEKTGNLVAREKRKEGPTMVMMTTTNAEVAEEKANRMLILSADEDREQTRRIHERQRESQTLAGRLKQQEQDAVRRRHQNMQRLIQPYVVVNEHARRLTYPDTCLRTRRDHGKYLALIEASALLHQHQRPIRQVERGTNVLTYIEATPADIGIANRLADLVLGRSLDELSPQARRLLGLIEQMVTSRCAEKNVKRSDFRFSRRDAREYVRWSNFQVKMHMRKLEDLEYVLAHRGARGISYEYELLYDGRGQNGRRFCMGLIDVSEIRALDDKKEHEKGDKEHRNGHLEGSRSPQVAHKEAGRSTPIFDASPTASDDSPPTDKKSTKTHIETAGVSENTSPTQILAASAK